MTVLLATVGAWAQGDGTTPVVADGVYTIENVYNGRGTMCYGTYNSTEYFGLAGITLSGYSGKSVTVVDETKKYWYVKTTANATYIYNVGKGVFLQAKSGATATCAEAPGELALVSQTVNGTDYVNIKSSSFYISFSCGYTPNNNQFRWGGLDSHGSQLTFAAVENAAATYATQIAYADALIADYEAVEADVEIVYSRASSWTQTAVCPEALESIPGHVGTAGHTVYKKGTMVSVKNAGDRTVTFTYTSGSCGIQILGADLVSSAGTVVASDYHVGFAGGRLQNNVYTLSSVPAGTYLLRFFVCNDGSNRVDAHTGKATVTSVIEPSQTGKTAYFNSLKTAGTNKYASCNHATNNGKPGYYTQATLTALNDANTAAAGVDAGAVAVADVFPLAEAIEHLQVVLPEAGKFYRIKNNAGNAYLTCGTSGTAQTAADAQGNMKEDVFYLTDDNKLISYANGLYFDVLSGMLTYKENVGAGVADFTFYVSPTLGKLYVEFTAAGGNHRFLYSTGAGATNAGTDNSAGQSVLAAYPDYRFTVEEVTWLPVPMNAEVGYASLYSPISLNCEGRVEAYIATTVNDNNTSIRLEKCPAGIPANTGVILKYVENAEINATTGCLYLSVNGGEVAAPEGNALLGGVAAANISEGAYVLANGTNGVGLYKAMMNQSNNTAWKNNGFKAYLPASAIPADAPSLSFVFDTETGIEGVGAAKAGKSAIYDLSGRRVQSAQKGIYIINGKKIVK